MPAAFVLIVNYCTGPLVVDCLASLAFELPAFQGGRLINVDYVCSGGVVGQFFPARNQIGFSELAKLSTLPHAGSAEYRETGAAESLRPHGPMQLPLLGACAGPTTFGVASN